MVLSCPCRSPGSTQRRASRGQGDPGSRGASPGISAVILPLRDKQVELSSEEAGGCSKGGLTLPSASSRNLSAIQDREICCYSISCKEKDNIGKKWRMFLEGRVTLEGASNGISVHCPLLCQGLLYRALRLWLWLWLRKRVGAGAVAAGVLSPAAL